MPGHFIPSARRAGHGSKAIMTSAMPFVCSICEEESTRICVRCTKDTCANHLCEKCSACSDCCDCEVRLEAEVEAPILQEEILQEEILQQETAQQETAQEEPAPENPGVVPTLNPD